MQATSVRGCIVFRNMCAFRPSEPFALRPWCRRSTSRCSDPALRRPSPRHRSGMSRRWPRIDAVTRNCAAQRRIVDVPARIAAEERVALRVVQRRVRLHARHEIRLGERHLALRFEIGHAGRHVRNDRDPRAILDRPAVFIAARLCDDGNAAAACEDAALHRVSARALRTRMTGEARRPAAQGDASSCASHFFRMRTRASLKSTRQFIQASSGIIRCGFAAFT